MFVCKFNTCETRGFITVKNTLNLISLYNVFGQKYLFALLGRGVVVGALLVVVCDVVCVVVVEDCVACVAVVFGAAAVFCASVELKPKRSRTRGIHRMFSSFNERTPK